MSPQVVAQSVKFIYDMPQEVNIRELDIAATNQDSWNYNLHLVKIINVIKACIYSSESTINYSLLCTRRSRSTGPFLLGYKLKNYHSIYMLSSKLGEYIQ